MSHISSLFKTPLMPRSSLESAAQNTLPTPSFHVREHILFKVVVLTYTELFIAAHLVVLRSRRRHAISPKTQVLNFRPANCTFLPPRCRRQTGLYSCRRLYLFMEWSSSRSNVCTINRAINRGPRSSYIILVNVKCTVRVYYTCSPPQIRMVTLNNFCVQDMACPYVNSCYVFMFMHKQQYIVLTFFQRVDVAEEIVVKSTMDWI